MKAPGQVAHQQKSVSVPCEIAEEEVLAALEPSVVDSGAKKFTFSLTACESAINGKSGSSGASLAGSLHIIQRESERLLVKTKPEYQLLRVTAASGKQVYDVRGVSSGTDCVIWP